MPIERKEKFLTLFRKTVLRVYKEAGTQCLLPIGQMQVPSTGLEQKILEENTNFHRTVKSSNSSGSSFTVKDILQWPSSVNATAEELVSLSSGNTKHISSLEMLAHDLYPQNRLRHLSMSNYQPEERHFAERYPQFLDSRSQRSSEPTRFPFSQENSQSLNGLIHQDPDPRTNEVFSPEKRVQTVKSSPQVSESTSPILNLQNQPSFSGSMRNKDSFFPKNCLENPNVSSAMSSKTNYENDIKFSHLKEKFDSFHGDVVPAEFHDGERIRKSDNEVFLPDDSMSSSTSQSEWPKIEDKMDGHLQGKKN